MGVKSWLTAHCVRMLELFCQVLLQGLLVALQASAVLGDCCPVKHVQGLGPLSGTYILVPTSPDTQFPPECSRDSCNYVKDEHPDPEKLFCFKFDRSVTSDVKCQQDSDFAPQFLTEGQLKVSVLSLNASEGEELLRISQEFPPPEDEVLNFCNADCTHSGLVNSEGINMTLSYGSSCHAVLLEEDS